MLRAIYVRTLKPGITDEQFVASWMPDEHTRSSYPAAVTVARSLANPRQVLSVFDIDVNPERLADVLPDLVHPDSEARLAVIVESTQIEDVFTIADHFGADQSPGA
ncbi:MAG: hypothetical protein ACRDUX_06820 [Mycobacterium sp.]